MVQDSRLDQIFFAKQVIQNACATQAILSVLLNVDHKDIKLGETLSDFKEFTQSFDAYNKGKKVELSALCTRVAANNNFNESIGRWWCRQLIKQSKTYFGASFKFLFKVTPLNPFLPPPLGLAMSNASQIRTVHNSFARQTLFEMDNSKNNKDEDVFHFISYLPINGRLYELDGLKEGPIDLGVIGDRNWLDAVRPVIEKRIQKYSEGEIHFNLMAMVSDRQMLCQNQLDALLNASDDAMETDTKQSEIAKLKIQIDDEILKRKRYKVRWRSF